MHAFIYCVQSTKLHMAKLKFQSSNFFFCVCLVMMPGSDDCIFISWCINIFLSVCQDKLATHTSCFMFPLLCQCSSTGFGASKV